ncbi:biotin--[acetyl-CoA-carboxylase] ligase [Pseudaestuariivita atlantica]|uniref:biotin--[biotin carboxyl-carrier protein] ligase n=1 Tax=Pseudaestuariivita atlantica TaxID=1317121 RepID=A0A0L1JL43_9RHOB|nr:biotin--[acetyl-CoA-carboxylase] ligase [Pseudaestuariivita atlantica]KNG92465.1 biotin--acetyl-CoA-carboxylase ligase [Pseudaestuariivita atlantica]
MTYQAITLDTVDSTMAEAARRMEAVTGPTWIMARQQTEARGRRGRAWSMPPGNFAATLILPLSDPPDRAALRSFVAALALADAFAATTGRTDPFTLKWPNDVLLNGGKVAGILLERHGLTSPLLIGIGVNLATAPGVGEVEARAARPVALASATGTTIALEDFLDALAPAFATREDAFRTYGFDPIRTAWLARAARLGEVITARTATSETTGTFDTVDNQGCLVLNTAKGRVTIPAADVYF